MIGQFFSIEGVTEYYHILSLSLSTDVSSFTTHPPVSFVLYVISLYRHFVSITTLRQNSSGFLVLKFIDQIILVALLMQTTGKFQPLASGLQIPAGSHTIDCFASFYNKKISKFFSRFWNPGSSGVDFFVQNLVDENCLVVSPVSLISRAIHYLYVSKATATIVIPVWLSSYFWPIISMKFASSIGAYKWF